MRKLISTILVFCVTCSLFVLQASASSPENENSSLSLYDLNTSRCTYTFTIDSNGLARTTIIYAGIPETFVEINAEVKIQKKFLGIFWLNVSIGEPDNVWSATSANLNAVLSKSFQLNETGTYRAVFDIEVIGINGNDIIEDKIQATYD